MAETDRFSRTTVITLAKRAANQCSNPDCGAITSGPADIADKSVNVGEAAHIYGANPGSARYDAGMLPAQRSSITNAIWLCGNCHKLVDDDSSRYPAGLLFEWQREHEKHIGLQVGKASAHLRNRYEKRHLQKFGEISYAAERLILEKEPYWEYLLTAQVMRDEVQPYLRRAHALRRGLYIKQCTRVPKKGSFYWISDRSSEIGNLVRALAALATDELATAWGAPGVPGDDELIVETARLFSELCKSAIEIEENIRFSRLDSEFERVQNLFIGVTVGLLEHVERIPNFLLETISAKPTSGQFELLLKIELPEGWAEEVSEAIEQARQRIIASGEID